MFLRLAALSGLVIVTVLIVEHSNAQGGFNAWNRQFRPRSPESDNEGFLGKNIRNRNRNQPFLRRVERRLANGKPIFSPRAIRMLQRNGWSDKYFKLPHQKMGKAFGFCDLSRELDVKQMFPGLFRSEADIRNLPEMTISQARINPVIHRNWKATAALSIEVPEEAERKPSPVNNQGLIGFRQNNSNVTSNVPRGSSSTRIDPSREFICQCCKVRRYFQAFENITIEGDEYQVIDLNGARQFFATEKCPEVNQCQFGGCVQRYTTHPILIWNSSLPYYPSLGFAQLEIPTHCEWANIGMA